MKNILRLSLLFICLIVMVGCGKKDDNKLVMVTEAGFAPYEYYENGEIVGVDVDIAKEIAKELGVTKEEVVMSLDAIQDPVSLQEPVYNEGSESIYIMDQVKDSKNTDELWAENITVAEAMKKLNKREKTIISKRFFDGRTQMEVAEEIGISQAQVSRLEKSAIERIKKMYK